MVVAEFLPLTRSLARSFHLFPRLGLPRFVPPFAVFPFPRLGPSHYTPRPEKEPSERKSSYGEILLVPFSFPLFFARAAESAHSLFSPSIFPSGRRHFRGKRVQRAITARNAIQRFASRPAAWVPSFGGA